MLDQHQLHRLLDLIRDLVQVFAVLVRQDEGLDAGPMGRQQFLLEAADRKDLPPQRDLSGHRHVAAHRPVGQHGHHGRGHGDPG